MRYDAVQAPNNGNNNIVVAQIFCQPFANRAYGSTRVDNYVSFSHHLCNGHFLQNIGFVRIGRKNTLAGNFFGHDGVFHQEKRNEIRCCAGTQ